MAIRQEFVVLDASVVGRLLADDDDESDRVRARVDGTLAWAPGLIDLEVLSLIRRSLLAGDLEEQRAGQAVEDLAALRVRRVGTHLLHSRIWELRHNLTAYDAAYVAVAERLDAPLLTADARLAGAPGPRCVVEIMR